jgi:hypothetical protein
MIILIGVIWYEFIDLFSELQVIELFVPQLKQRRGVLQ